MLIGKPGAARTAICGRVERQGDGARPRPRQRSHGPRRPSPTMSSCSATGRTPTDEQRFFLDLSLVALAEHGLTPSVQAARMTYDADPAALQGAIAAGVLGCGTVILGAADLCREADRGRAARASTPAGSLDARRARRSRASIATARKPLPGYGHPLHKPVDPRAERMIALARERGVAGPLGRGGARADQGGRRGLGQAAADERLDDDRGDAARCRRSARPIRAVPILARTAGLIAHCIEEAETPIGFLMASKGEEAIVHTADARREPPDADGRARDRERARGRARRAPTRRSISSRSNICSSARASIAASSSAPASPRTARSAASRRSRRCR